MIHTTFPMPQAEVAADAARAEVKQLRESLLMAKRDAAAAALKLEAAEKGAVDRCVENAVFGWLSLFAATP